MARRVLFGGVMSVGMAKFSWGASASTVPYRHVGLGRQGALRKVSVGRLGQRRYGETCRSVVCGAVSFRRCVVSGEVSSVCFVQVYPVQVGRIGLSSGGASRQVGEECHVQLSNDRSHCFDSKSFGADSRYGEGGMPPPHYVRT